jgi:hypothetical protein
VTSAVKAFVITRSYSMCSRPSLPWTRCGAPLAATCNAVGAEAAGPAAASDTPTTTTPTHAARALTPNTERPYTRAPGAGSGSSG